MNSRANVTNPRETGNGMGVVVVGSINVDLLTTVPRHPAPGETVSGTEMRTLSGGKGANQAVAAAQLGSATSFIGSVGKDPYAAVATERLRAAGVDVTRVVAAEGTTGVAFVTVDANGENTIVVMAGANAQTTADAVDKHRDAIARAAVLVVQGEIPASGTQAAVAAATGRVVLNLAPVISLPAETIRTADPLVVNEHEAALVLHQLSPMAPVPAEHSELTAALVAAGPRSVVLTRGALGAMFSNGSGVHSVPAPRVDVVDTAGAGDAFVGALSGRLAAGDSLGEAVEFASRVGAYSVQHLGTQLSYPTSTDELPGVIQ